MAIYMPWNNAGCLGISIGGSFYADIFTRPYFGIYLRIGLRIMRIKLTPIPRILQIIDYRTDVPREWKRGRGWK